MRTSLILLLLMSAGLLMAACFAGGAGTAAVPTEVAPTGRVSAPGLPATAPSAAIAPPLPTAPQVPPTLIPPPQPTARPSPSPVAARESAPGTTGRVAEGGGPAVSTATPPLPEPSRAGASVTLAASATAFPDETATAPAAEAVPDVDIIVDDRDPGFSTTGAWFEGDGGASYNNGCHWAPPGVGNIAYVKPELPLAGSYDVFAWGCGDPNHDQAWLTTVMVYPFRSGRYAPPTVQVNLKEDVGRWVPIGTYYFDVGGSLSIGSPYYGNTAVDAFRFVYRTPGQVVITPEPAPTSIPWTNHPPSPHEQMSSGDLEARLGLVQRFYQYTPAVGWEQVRLDDCTAFPREGCGGTREAWQARVEYRGREYLSVPYRVSMDLQHVALDAPEQLKGRQLLYLFGQNLTRIFYVYRYPDGSWQVVSTNTASGSGSQVGLTPEQHASLSRLVGEYSSIGTGSKRIYTPDGWELRLYGLGRTVALTSADRDQLMRLVTELGSGVLP